MNKWIDAKAICCAHCGSQIRFFHKRITDWALQNNNNIESSVFGHRCLTCNTQLNDKRKKYCNDECNPNK